MTDYRHEEAFTSYGERNPYYPEPILPDTIHHGPIRDYFPPRPRSVTVEENIKVAEIKDAFKNLRFKVSLTSFDSCYVPEKKQYQVQVISYNGYQNPLVIVTRPSHDERRIYDYDYALKLYEQYVAKYTCLVKAETKDFQDITLYKDQIGYKLTQPKCCFTCKWCKKSQLEVDFQIGSVGRLECLNPKSCQAYNFDSEHRHAPWNEHCHDPRIHAPNCYDYDKMCLNIHPEVDILGVCDNYEKLIGEWHPYPGQRISELVNIHVTNTAEDIVPDMVNYVLSTELTAELSVPVIQAVTMVLSSPEASVALSAPVINVVTNSPTVNANTINVIGTALSTDVLSAQTYHATVTALEQPEISAALIDPVANVIPVEPVSSNVVSAAATGIKLEKIIGNDALRYQDKNKNNIPDEYEEDIVIGGEGA